MTHVITPLSEAEVTKRKKSARIVLALLFLFPLLIVGAASFVYFTGIGIPHKTNSKGILISPPLQITDLSLVDAQGQSATLETPAHQWTFMQIGNGVCDAVCTKTLWQIHQTRIALGKYQSKIRMAYLDLDLQARQPPSVLATQEYADVQVVYTNKEQALRLFANTHPDIDIAATGQMFVVDPQGFIMLYYTDMMRDEKMRYKDVIADMKHLFHGQE